MDEAFVTRKLKPMLSAKLRRWNPTKQTYAVFDDYATQLAALRLILEVLGGFVPEKEEEKPVMINISAIPMRRERVNDQDAENLQAARLPHSKF